MSYPQPHWTDTAPRPVFETCINATGPGGNVFAILGAATLLLRRLNVPADRVDRLREDVMGAGDYDAAIACIENWFPVDRDEQ